MLRTITIAGLLLLVAPAALAQTALPTLKPSATITAELVRIGDLVEHPGPLAEIAIFRAPDLGTTGAVPTARLREALRPYGLSDFHAAGLVEVVVSRPGRAVTVKEVEQRILEALAGQRGLGAVEDLKLSLDQPLRTFYIEADATAALQVMRLSIDPYATRFSIVLDIPGSAVLRRTPLRLSGRVIETAETAVLTRALDRGDLIRPGDFAIERRPRAEIGKDDIGRPVQAIGLAARRPLRVGHVLRHSDLMKPELVKRGESVTLVYEVPGILLTLRGQAGEAGAEGDVISVVNLQSKRTVQGTVTGPGQVTVTSGTARILPAKTASLHSSSTPAGRE
jgi:flagellar basal body P-ring formation protein FlgA